MGLHAWLALHVDLLDQVRLVGPACGPIVPGTPCVGPVDLLDQVRLIGPVDLLDLVHLVGPVHGPILVQHAQWGE